ncbi:MAG: triose-phosphate isomerase [Eubacteriales bacterium]|nr:triose-phosphate isomerase [Eubacteriales bacterium]
MKKLYFGSNLKMYKNIRETTDYLIRLQKLTQDLEHEKITLFIIPSYTSLDRASGITDQNQIMLGAQNMCWEEVGQFTGEISPLMLQELGIKIVELGHSERRHIFGETNEIIGQKVKAALEHGFIALLCIGETGKEKQCGISDEILRIQLKTGLSKVCEEELDKLWIAYEPVWAIGVNGLPASSDYAQEKHHVIKNILQELFGEPGKAVPVLYGGSVNLENAGGLIQQPDIDGLFVGRSAWDAEKFNQLIRDATEAVNMEVS